MALPLAKSAAECADFSKTVLPYVHQLGPLPRAIFESISNPGALKQIYLETNPLIFLLNFTLFLAPIFLVLSELNRNYSQVDRAWSILPTLYNAHYVIYAHLTGLETRRLDALLVVSIIWSVSAFIPTPHGFPLTYGQTRLTFNYWRKGGYNIGSEDYRWEVLRSYLNPGLFFLFNVIFISFAQLVLLFLITTPTYVLLVAARLATVEKEMPSWDDLDLLGASAIILFVLLSFIADQQQWNFQQAKAAYSKTAKVPAPFKQADLDRGFVSTGLWAYSRHPNFAAEQAVWISFYHWSCFTTGVLGNWSAVGPLGYVALFQASTWFTELITAKKYPEYKLYQKLVAKFIPKRGSGAMKWIDEQVAESETTKKDLTKAKQRYNLR